jgi:hypothetical protein
LKSDDDFKPFFRKLFDIYQNFYTISNENFKKKKWWQTCQNYHIIIDICGSNNIMQYVIDFTFMVFDTTNDTHTNDEQKLVKKNFNKSSLGKKPIRSINQTFSNYVVYTKPLARDVEEESPVAA